MRSFIIALEKGMWVGWSIIALFVVIFIVIGGMQIREEDLVLTHLPVAPYLDKDLIVNGFDTIEDNSIYNFLPYWLGFCGVVMLLKCVSDPYVKEPEYICLDPRGSYHDGESLFKIAVLFFCWFSLVTFIGVLLASYYPRIPIIINGEIYTYKSGFDFWNEAPRWMNNLASIICFPGLLYIGYLCVKGKNDKLDSR